MTEIYEPIEFKALVENKERRVRTAAGVRRFGQPIGTVRPGWEFDSPRMLNCVQAS